MERARGAELQVQGSEKESMVKSAITELFGRASKGELSLASVQELLEGFEHLPLDSSELASFVSSPFFRENLGGLMIAAKAHAPNFSPELIARALEVPDVDPNLILLLSLYHKLT